VQNLNKEERQLEKQKRPNKQLNQLIKLLQRLKRNQRPRMKPSKLHKILLLRPKRIHKPSKTLPQERQKLRLTQHPNLKQKKKRNKPNQSKDSSTDMKLERNNIIKILRKSIQD